MAAVATLRDIVSALVDSTTDSRELAVVKSDMENFFDHLSGSGEFRDVLVSTVFSREEKKSVVNDFLSAASYRDVTAGFILLALEMDKIPALLSSRGSVLARLDEAAGRVIAEIVSATPLESGDIERLSEAISSATGKTVDAVVDVDPSMIGGIKVKVGDKVYDNSVRTQLERIRGILSQS